MIENGIVEKYNKRYGTIKNIKGELISFSNIDISFDQDIKEKDEVEYRLEESYGIKLARNINKIRRANDVEKN